MILTRTPLRISLGGGGTDLPSYYRREGGAVIAAAIDKYVYIAVNGTFTDDYLLKYSEHERVQQVAEIRHGLIREVLDRYDVEPGIEVVSVADIPAGTGLGSSGSFTVGLILALHAYRHQHLSAFELAEAACHIEIDRLGDAVGKQDQYIAAHGGVVRFDFHPDDTVTTTDLGLAPGTIDDLTDHLLLFFTGFSRRATDLLADQQVRTQQADPTMLRSLDDVVELCDRIDAALRAGDTAGFGGLMHEHWVRKRERSEGITNPQIDEWYELGRANGAIGGKLVGAGGGGFLLFSAEDPAKLRHAMAGAGLPEVRFGFDFDGAVVLARS